MIPKYHNPSHTINISLLFLVVQIEKVDALPYTYIHNMLCLFFVEQQ